MKKFLSVAFVFALALSLTGVALAQTQTAPGSSLTVPGGDIGTGTITSTGQFVSIVTNLLSWIAWAVGLLSVLMGLYAGILFITAGGNAENVTKARNILLYAMVGIAVAVLAFSIVSISTNIVGL